MRRRPNEQRTFRPDWPGGVWGFGSILAVRWIRRWQADRIVAEAERVAGLDRLTDLE